MAVMILVFAGCSNPAAGINLPNSGKTPIPIPEVLGPLFGSGAEITENGDSSYTVVPGENFDGKIPIPVILAVESDYIIKGDDGNYLDLTSLDEGGAISITMGDSTYIITKNEDGSYTFTPQEAEPPQKTDRQVLDEYIGRLKAALTDFIPGDDGVYSLVLPYSSEELSLTLPVFPEGLGAVITQDDHTVAISGGTVTFPLSPDTTSIITIALVLNEEKEDITLQVTREPAIVIPVTKITLSLGETSLVGKVPFDPVKVGVIIEPGEATNKLLAWESSDENVVKVSGGVLSPQKSSSGKSVTIIAKATDGSGVEGSIEITVVSNDTSIGGLKVEGLNAVASGSAFTASVGNSVVAANVTFVKEDNATARYRKSTESGYTSLDGTSFAVDGLEEGENAVFIEVRAENGDTENYTLTITRETADIVLVSGISLAPSTLTLTAGEASGTLGAEVLPVDATNQSINWISSNPGIARVEGSGTTVSVIPVSRGSAEITAHATDSGGKTSNVVTVVVQSGDNSISDLKVNNVAVSLNSSPLTYSGTAASAAVSFGLPAGATAVWGITGEPAQNPAYGSFTVDNLGVGDSLSITITITAENGASKTYTLLVTRTPTLVSGIELTPNPLMLNQGETGKFTAKLSPSDPTKTALAWSSDNPSVAEVDAVTGIVTAVGGGTAVVTASATDGSGVSGSAIVSVQYQSDQGISLGWADGPVPLKASYGINSYIGQTTTANKELAITIMQGGTVTLSTQETYTSYEWSIGGAVKGNESSYQFTGTTAGTFKILLWVNGRSKGATVIITVEESGTVNVTLN